MKTKFPLRWARVAELLIGFSTNFVTNWLFDWVLYPFVIWKMGLLWGGIIMSILSLISCLLLLVLYDALKRDWFGIEALKQIKYDSKSSGAKKLLAKTLKKGDVAAFFFLSIQFDPFITVSYLRHEAYSGMKKRDWIIFFASWIIGNGSWIFACYFGVSFLRYLWEKFF